MKKISNLINPVSLILLGLALSLWLYSLKYSDLFEYDISSALKSLYIETTIILIAALTVILIFNTKNQKNIPNIIYKIKPSSKDDLSIFCITFLFIAQSIYSGYIPIFHGYSDLLESSYGFPIINGLYLSYLSYSSAFFFQSYLSSKKTKPLFYVFIVNIILILCARRGALIFNFLTCFFAYFYFLVYCSKIKFKHILISLISIISILVSFNIIGNIRLGEDSNKYILDIGKASQEFRDSIIPKSLFFAYIYISSPVLILDNNLENQQKGLDNLLIESIIPKFITEKIGVKNTKEVESVNGFNVGSFLLEPYHYAGKTGVYFYIIYFLTLCLINVIYIRKNKKRAFIMLCMLNSVAMLLTFQNLINHTAYILPIIYSALFRDFRIK